MTRVAALDCGTNSLRLLVADVEPALGELADVVRQMEIVRLGQGVDRTGRLGAEALGRTFDTLRRYAKTIAATGAGSVRMVATSATRDAANAAEFTSGVRAILGVEPEVISGDEEAALSFAGATAELAAVSATIPRPCRARTSWLTSAVALPSSCSACRAVRQCGRGAAQWARA